MIPLDLTTWPNLTISKRLFRPLHFHHVKFMMQQACQNQTDVAEWCIVFAFARHTNIRRQGAINGKYSIIPQKIWMTRLAECWNLVHGPSVQQLSYTGLETGWGPSGNPELLRKKLYWLTGWQMVAGCCCVKPFAKRVLPFPALVISILQTLSYNYRWQ